MSKIANVSMTTNSAEKKALYLSHFTPSMMSPETLEAMLVQREPVLSRCLDNVIESLKTGSSHHTLFVGPRGIGKTHLISLLQHRLAKTTEANDKALIAWMREEEWGVTSFFELVLRILRTLDASYPELGVEAHTSAIYELPIKQAEQRAESLLLETIGEKRLVVFLENLDDLFEQLGDHGQKAWRAFIQNHNNMILVCTTPSLFAGVSLQKSPFYGFFDIEPLVELNFEDVVSLLGKIAIERGDGKLASFIETPEGRARIRAVHHLAEGNPRIYIIFAQFLSREALEELVQAFMHTLDELTPYYQARMKELPGQQRKIIEYLVQYRGAASVKQIAKSCFITSQTCSSQLKQLKEKKYVRSEELGRESFYELTEPLMRLCMEVKKQRGEPISLLVEILRIWYSMKQLMELADGCADGYLDKSYITTAIEKSKREKSDPKLAAQIKDFKKLTAQGNGEGIGSLLEEMSATQYESKNSENMRSIVVLCACVSPSVYKRNRIAANSAQLARGFLDFLMNGSQKLKKGEAEETFVTVALASLGLFFLDRKLGRQAIPPTVEFLAQYPALGHVALIAAVTMVPGKPKEKWIEMIQNEAESEIRDPVIQRFLRSGNRMHSAFHEYVSSSDEKKLLRLPIEERKLLKTRFAIRPKKDNDEN